MRKTILSLAVIALGFAIFQNRGRFSNITKPNTRESTKTLVQQRVVDEESAVIEVVEKASPAVVSIVVREVVFNPFSGPLSQDASIGTGFIVDGSGIVFTNRHVVSQDAEYTVVSSDGRSFNVKSIAKDPLNDFAVLTIDPNDNPPAGGGTSDLPAISLGDSDLLKVGQTVIAIGNALGRFSNTVTKGVVSALDRGLTASSGFFGSQTTYLEDVIQTDAALNPGNSGGPLVNLSGQVIGINVAVTSGAENIGFSIPINTVKAALSDFKVYGRIRRPFLGVEYVMVTEDISKLQRLPQGAFIKRIVSDSPANSAGLKVGDVITKFAGEDINEDNGLSRVIRKHQVGDRVSLEVDREGKTIALEAALGEAPEE